MNIEHRIKVDFIAYIVVFVCFTRQQSNIEIPS